MLIALTLLIAASLAPAALMAFNRRRYYFPFLLILLYYCIQLPLMLDQNSIFTADDIISCCLYAAISNVVLSLSLYSLDKRMISNNTISIIDYDLSQISIIAIFSALLSLFVFIIYYSGTDINDNVWTQREENYLSLYGPLFSYIGFLIFAFWTILRSFGLKALLLPILLLVFMSTGARVIFMVIFGAFWLFAIRKMTQRQILFYGGFAGAGFIAIHVIGRVLRSVGVTALLAGDWSYIGGEIAKSDDLTGGDGSIGEGFVLAIPNQCNRCGPAFYDNTTADASHSIDCGRV